MASTRFAKTIAAAIRTEHMETARGELELYTVVLSSSTLCLALVFGSAGCVTIFVSMCTGKLLRKLQYIILAILLILCSIMDLVWCPLEMYRLISYHHDQATIDTVGSALNDHETLRLAGQSLYIFLLTALACTIVLISVQNCLIASGKLKNSAPRFKHLFGLFGLLAGTAISVGVAVTFGLVAAASSEETFATRSGSAQKSTKTCFQFKMVLFTLWIMCLVTPLLSMLVYHLVIGHKKHSDNLQTGSISECSEIPNPEQINLNVPTFLIKDTDEDEQSVASGGCRRKSSEQLQSKQKASAIKEDNTSTVGELPSPGRGKTHLGINMSAILGRRRHTIGQIGETGLDLMQKAKSYNYVRKFSVDVNALQAQLENPKIHDNFPFRSDTDLQKGTNKPQGNDIASPALPAFLLEKDNRSAENKLANNHHAASNTISTEHRDSVDQSQENTNPPIITLTESIAEERHDSVENLNTDVHNPNLLKLSCLLTVTFICCILPMYITEAVSRHLSLNAYVNIVACTTALSAVQTIIYPHILFCMDATVHAALHQLFTQIQRQIARIHYGQQEVPSSDPMDASDINITQV